MKGVGWILDVHIDDTGANLWVKLDNGQTIRLTDKYRPDFYIELKNGVDPEELAQTISLHPLVFKAGVEEKYTSILNTEKSKVVHISVYDTSSFRSVKDDIEKLDVVKFWFNLDIYHFQRYLFSKNFAPTNKVELEWNENGHLVGLTVIDDFSEVSPPPLSSFLFEVNIKSNSLTPNVMQDPIKRIVIQKVKSKIETLKGAESDVLTGFSSHVINSDPDFLVANNLEETLLYIFKRAEILGINLQLGRESTKNYTPKNLISAVRGRALIEMNDFLEYGVEGISELSRFTLASPTLSAKWPAGKRIDARQNFEALKKGLLIPKRRGFLRFSITAKEIHGKDKGGLLFSPVAGLHENVAELDFESMFPNIIIHHNISYETVTPTCTDMTRQGFLGEVVKTVLDRRLNFKHLRKKFPRNSDEYNWYDQRQKALKSVLVCIYGFSGCFANRFNNMATYNEINAISRRLLVRAINICLSKGFDVIYGNMDSIFIKHSDATRDDYEKIAKTIQNETGLPIVLDNYYKFIVFMKQETHSDFEAMNHFFGKTTNGKFNFRGIELRRRDCPALLKEFQRRLIEILFDAEDKQDIIKNQVAKAKNFIDTIYQRVKKGDTDPIKLTISKHVRKDLNAYTSMFPLVIAAKHLAWKGKKIEKNDTVDFIYTNARHSNTFRRVIPVAMIYKRSVHYDREKYGQLILDTANTVLKPIVMS